MNYDMIISGGDLGGITEVRITPLHSFNQITPRLDNYLIFLSVRIFISASIGAGSQIRLEIMKSIHFIRLMMVAYVPTIVLMLFKLNLDLT